MRSGPVVELVRGVSRFAVVAVIGGMAAACSADSMRFSETPFANPFGSGQQSDPGMTGSIDAAAPAAAAPRMPRSSVSSAPLAPVTAAAPVYNRPVAAAAPAPVRSAGASGWSVEGGTSITVGSADSLTTISDRYGVPGAAILSANGITARDVSAGRRLVIPVYSAIGRNVAQAAPAAPVRHAAAPQPAPRMEAAPARPRVIAAAPLAPEPRTTASTEPKVKPRPGRETNAAAPLPAPKPVVAAAKPEPAKPAPVAGKVVKSEPLPAAKPKSEATKAQAETKAVAAAKPAPAAKAAAAEPAKPAPEPVKTASRDPDSTASVAPAAPAAEFRWPARGRVISGFTGSNEGINIAVPDGTPVKAAESGTVAYAGSEVKGYGNLVLIRHDNGYVSAYAHNGDIDVKRGQKVSRGQTIAKSGQTGNVTSPQIHFEIRKGSTPVDPMKYLASN